MGKIQEVPVPDIGDFDEVDVIEVLVSAGDTVAADDSLITLESDKASMEVPSPAAGVVQEVKVSPGDKIGQGAVILTLEVEDMQADAEPEEDTKRSDAAAKDGGKSEGEDGEAVDDGAEASGEPPQGSSGAAPSTSGEASNTTRRGESAGASHQDPEASQRAPVPGGGSPDAGAASGGATSEIDEESFAKAHASPAVRRYARELGVDLGRVEGTGRKGRILKEDVQGFVKKAIAAPAGPAAGGAGFSLPEMPEFDFSKFGEVEVQPLSRIQKIAGTHLSRAWITVPHVTQFDEADVTDMEAFRKEHGERAKAEGFKLTPVAFLLKAVARALADFPTFNASLSADRESLILKKYVHIGVAVDTPRGLVVPVIREVDKKGLFELAKELGETSARARDGKLTPKDLSGGCFSISSLGGIGGTAFTPIVNAPEVAILGVSRSAVKPVWRDGEFVPRLMLPLSLSYDHRVIDGAAAARFTVHLSGLLGDLRRLLL